MSVTKFLPYFCLQNFFLRFLTFPFIIASSVSIAVLLNQVYLIPKCISNQNHGILLRKSMRRVYRFELGSFFKCIKYDCEKIDSTYFLSYFPWQIKLTLLSSAKPTCKLDGSLPANPVNDRRIANAVTLKSTFCLS